MNVLTKGRAKVSSLLVGLNAPTPINGIQMGSVTLTPTAIPANSKGSVTFALAGAFVGDFVDMQQPVALENSLLPLGAAVTSTGTVTVWFHNNTGTPVTGASLVWLYLWIKLT